jgi:hypothetical protein
MKTYGEAEVSLHVPSVSVTYEGELTASRFSPFTPRQRCRGTHWIGDWVGPSVGLDAVEKSKSCPCRESNPDSSVVKPNVYTVWAVTDFGDEMDAKEEDERWTVQVEWIGQERDWKQNVWLWYGFPQSPTQIPRLFLKSGNGYFLPHCSHFFVCYSSHLTLHGPCYLCFVK